MCALCGLSPVAPAFKYCDACRASKCRNCNRVGSHAAGCYLASPRLCVGCGEAPRTHDMLCEASHAQHLCATCGRHWRVRPHQHPPPRPATPFVGRVTIAEIEAMYAVTWRAALHRAERIVGPALAWDAVQNALTTMLRRRDYVKKATSGYFVQEVINQALTMKRPTWLVFVDPLDLVGLEHQQWRFEHGRRAEAR
jgi:hypothetical protein